MRPTADPGGLGSDDYSSWVGRSKHVEGTITVTSARALLATLGRSPTGLARGDRLPPLFHWLYCHDLTPSHELGDDGHEKGGFLPFFPSLRRMWAGGRLKFGGDLMIGDSVGRTSTIGRVVKKQGRQGPLILATVEHRISGPNGEVVEEQDLVFLERPTAPLVIPEEAAPSDAMEWSETFTPRVTTLFRFSALTFNAHRIHYDRDYTRDVEHYPDLVVHGPLTALLLATLGEEKSGRQLEAFEFRARRPLFVDRPVVLEGRPMDGESGGLEAELRALDPTGAIAMTAHGVVR